MTDSWRTRHFSLANPAGTPQTANTPFLLRRLADYLDDMGPIDLLDIVFRLDDPESPTCTVYFDYPDDDR